MFDKFGEFESCEQMNAAAAAQLAEGDYEAIRVIAEENGIDPEDADDFINGDLEELTTPLMAAYGKLAVESAELKPYEIMNDWIEYIKVRCHEEPAMAVAVRAKGKSLKGCIGALLKWSFQNSRPVDKDIVKAAGVSAAKVELGIPGIGRAKQIITDYYIKK